MSLHMSAEPVAIRKTKGELNHTIKKIMSKII